MRGVFIFGSQFLVRSRERPGSDDRYLGRVLCSQNRQQICQRENRTQGKTIFCFHALPPRAWARAGPRNLNNPFVRVSTAQSVAQNLVGIFADKFVTALSNFYPAVLLAAGELGFEN